LFFVFCFQICDLGGGFQLGDDSFTRGFSQIWLQVRHESGEESRKVANSWSILATCCSKYGHFKKTSPSLVTTLSLFFSMKKVFLCMLNWFFCLFSGCQNYQKKNNNNNNFRVVLPNLLISENFAIFRETLAKLVEFTIEQQKSSKIFPTF
jgi:hypothetical protein